MNRKHQWGNYSEPLEQQKRYLHHLGLGYQGEKAVGTLLVKNLPDTFVVCHDVQIDGENIDHIVIGDHTIFVIEVKTTEKNNWSSSRMRNTNKQIMRQVSWLKEFLHPFFQKNYWVEAILVVVSDRPFHVDDDVVGTVRIASLSNLIHEILETDYARHCQPISEEQKMKIVYCLNSI